MSHAGASAPPPVDDGVHMSDAAGRADPSASSPLHLVPAMQRSFQSLMHAIFEPSTNITELSAHVTSLVIAAKRVESYLHGWSASGRVAELSEEAQLEADCSDLEAELRHKQRLLAHYGSRMSEWAERYRHLEASNEEVHDSLYAIDEHNGAATG